MFVVKRKKYKLLTLLTMAIYMLSLLTPVLAVDSDTYLTVNSYSGPTGSVVINAGNEYTNSTSVTVTVAVHDDRGLGSMEVGISNDSNFNNVSWQPLTYKTANKDKSAEISWSLASDINGIQSVYVKFRKNNEKISPLYSDDIIFDNIAPTTAASPAGGFYNSTQTLTLSSEEGAQIYYTNNGDTPVPNNNPYTCPITITSDTTIKFIAVDRAGNASDVITETYTIDRVAPTVSVNPVGGIFNSNQTVTLNPSEQVKIYYTTNGDEPNTNSDIYSAPIAITEDTVLKYYAVDLAKNESGVYTESYTIDTKAPTVSAEPQGGLFKEAKDVTLLPSETATIYYTLDGTTPSTESNVYTQAIHIDSNTTLNFFAVDQANNPSEQYSQTYEIDTVAPTANADLADGIYNQAKTVNLLVNEPGSAIYFTTDGTTPTTNSTKYTDPLNIITTTELKFIAVDPAGNISQCYSAKYTIDTVKPTVRVSVPGGIYNESKSVTLTASEPADIYFTLDGSKPLPTSSKYEGAISINNEGVTTLKFAAIDKAGNTSKVYTRIYTIDTINPEVSADTPEGLYNTSQLVTLTSSESGDIFYTTDGTTPTSASPKYSAPIEISSTTTLKFFAIDLAKNSSSVDTAVYTIDSTAPVISLKGNSPITLEVGNPFNEPGYTATDNLDGDITQKVVVSSNVDSGKVGTYTVKYNVKDNAGNNAAEVIRTVNVILLNLSWPRDGAQLTDPQTTVSGHVKVGSSVKVNGQPAYPNAMGDFVKILPLNLGANTITVTATDAVGNVDTKQINVNAPSVTVTAPANNLITNQDTVTVTGKAATNSPLTVNNTIVVPESNGNYSTIVTLNEGLNTITISAGSTTITKTVTKDSIVPTLSVTSPASDISVAQTSFTVAGYVEAGVTLKINGQIASSNASGFYCKIVSLGLGPNPITVTATDAAGNVTSITRTITRTP